MFTTDAYLGSYISDHITKTPEGFLVCVGVPIARTGKQEYLASEIGLEGNKMVTVMRDEEEVFSHETLASFNGKPFTLGHPDNDVTIQDIKSKMKGILTNVRRGKNADKDKMIADIIVYDEYVIDQILNNNLREVSCGYSCNYVPNGDGTYRQLEIRGNHLSLVPAGRAGKKIAIRDEKVDSTNSNKNNNNFKGGKRKMAKKENFISKVLRPYVKDEMDIEDVVEILEKALPEEDFKEVVEVKEKFEEKENNDEMSLDDVVELLKKLHNRMDALEIPNVVEDDGSEELEEVLKEEVDDEEEKDHDIIIENDDEDEDEEYYDYDEDETEIIIKKDDDELKIVTDAAIKRVVKDMRPLIAQLPLEQRKKFNSTLTKSIKKNKKTKDSYKAIQRASARQTKPNNNSVAEMIAKRNAFNQGGK